MSPFIQSLILLIINIVGKNFTRIRNEKLEANRPSVTVKPASEPSIFRTGEEELMMEFEESSIAEAEAIRIEDFAPAPTPPPAPKPEDELLVPSPLPAEPLDLGTPQILVPSPSLFPGPAGDLARSLSEKGWAPRGNGVLNVVAIRNSNRDFDVFKCRIVHLVQEAGLWVQKGNWAATTYPGKYYTIDKLLNSAGAAILTQGKFSGIYTLSSHRGIYQALCQRGGPVSVFRDGNKDKTYDMAPTTIQNGMFGINVHATQNPDGAPANLAASRVHAASAGCLVFAKINDFVEARNEWRTAGSLGLKYPDLMLIDDNNVIDFGDIKMESVTPQVDENQKAWFPEGVNTVGVRNRNLMNVKGDDKWLFSLGRDDKGHHIFPSFPKGLRAGIIDLRTKFVKRKLRTIFDVISVYAPASDTIGSIPGAQPNSPSQYSNFVAMRMGISTADVLMTFREDGSVRSADQLFSMVSAMVAFENSSRLYLPRSIFDEALSLL